MTPGNSGIVLWRAALAALSLCGLQPAASCGQSPLRRPVESLDAPLACQGYCVVTLALEHRWVAGDEQWTDEFSGRRYRFADARRRAIFAAAPATYAPLLGGQSPVALVDDDRAVSGQLEFGTVYRDRLVFFVNSAEQKRFAQSPQRYFETAAALEASRRLRASTNAAAREPVDETPSLPVALAGYCPVTLLKTGKWVKGESNRRCEFGGYAWLLAGAEPWAAFSAEPSRFVSPSAGYCPVTYQRAGRIVRGRVEYAAEYGGRIYVLAGADAKQEFLANPERYREIVIRPSSEERPSAGQQPAMEMKVK